MSLTNLGIGFAGSDWTAYTPTFNGFGTVTTSQTMWRRVGDTLEVKGEFTSGTSAASAASITLPYSVDFTKIASSSQIVGEYQALTNTSMWTSTSAAVGWLFVNSSAPSAVYMSIAGSGTSLNAVNASSLISAGQVISFKFSVPIAGWSSNISIGMSSTYRISSYLANGTRVTTTPTALGQWRALIVNAGLIDTTPSVLPTANDGFRIYGNVSRSATSGTAGQPTNYQIFIGKGLKQGQFALDFWQSAGHSTPIDPKVYAFGSNQYGVFASYDEASGVLTLDASGTESSSVTTRRLGQIVGTNGSATDGYGDVTVFAAPTAVGIAAPRSMVTASVGNGQGSTNTVVRRYSNSVVTGSDLTFTDSATLGSFVSVNSDGVYSISATDSFAGAQHLAITINGTALTTGGFSVTAAQGMVAKSSTSGANNFTNASVTMLLRAGDVIRVQVDGVQGTGNASMLVVTKVSN